MTSTRPYLIRAFYDWIVDNNCTPHIVVNASFAGVDVPREYVENGQIVLNISVSAVQGLVMGDRIIEFQGRFGGRIYSVSAPMGSILAIYAKENGRGMVFAEEEYVEEEEKKANIEDDTGTDDDGGKGGKSGKGGKGKGDRPHLTIVK